MAYNFKEIEQRLQEKWEKEKIYETDVRSDKKKSYLLVEFPYPSGAGLHVGHVRSYTAMDIIARKRRAEGVEVLFPIGWDAFGLPAENYAIKTGIHPSITTRENIDNFRKQLKACGFSFDWDREVDTTDPKFYKWSQWIFHKLYEKGLAYKKKMPVNWCPKDKCVLANEEVVDGKCERCGADATKKDKEQWMLAITKYAERLDKDLDDTDYLPKIKTQQRNWIGMSEGSEISFGIKAQNFTSSFTVFTTRADTLFGCTYCVLAPEHALVEELLEKNILENSAEVRKYRDDAKQKLDIDRSAEGREKTGVKLAGVFAVNKVNGEEVPLFIADYVLPHYGTGAIMAVPAHDERDGEFADVFSLPKREVISSFYALTGNDAEKDGAETVVRNIVDPILLDKENNIYLVKDAGSGQIHLPGGGVDEGEKDEEALLREIKEETGFTDTHIEERLSLTTSVWGYRHPKQRNQRSCGPAFVVRLSSLNRVPSEVETGDLELVTAPLKDGLATISWPHHRAIVQFYLDKKKCFADDGVLIQSGEFTGLSSEEARRAITEKVGGKIVTKSKLRDWVFARQRYWGEPIPIVYDKDNVMHPVSPSEFPIVLPNVSKFEPTDSGESPLSLAPEWVNVRGRLNEEGQFISIENYESTTKEFSATGGAILKDGEEIVHRNVVDVIIKDTDGNCYVLKDDLFGYKLVGGGVEEGEDVIQAVLREVREETGFTNVKVTGKSNLFAKYAGYHERKKKNISTSGHCFEVTLHDTTKISSEDGRGEHSVVKIKKNELENILSWEHHKLFAKEYSEGGFASISEFHRETDTMPQWAGSSWYFMRYIDPHNDTAIGDADLLSKWLPVDWYNGGMEHTTLHLLYSRFWFKFLYDIGLVKVSEPYYKRTSQGMILGAGGIKMSKSLGNIVNPDDIVSNYGADVLRVFEMFIGPFDQAAAWDDKAIIGIKRFLDRVEAFSHTVGESEAELTPLTERTIKAVGDGIEAMSFNTCISTLMIWLNEYEKSGINKTNFLVFLKLLSPFAPFLTEELYSRHGKGVSVHTLPWPNYDEAKLVDKETIVAVQVGGKLRGSVTVQTGASENDVHTLVKECDFYKKYAEDREPKKVIFVPNKIINYIF